MRTVLDIETDSLDANNIHCVVAKNIDENKTYSFIGEDCYTKLPNFINNHCKEIIMHSISYCIVILDLKLDRLEFT